MSDGRWEMGKTYLGDEILHFLREVCMSSFIVEFEVYSCYTTVCICKRTKSVIRTRDRENGHTIYTPPVLKRRETRNKLKSQDTKGPILHFFSMFFPLHHLRR